MCYPTDVRQREPAATAIRARCPHSLTGGPCIWYFDTAPDGKLRHRCVWCQRWWEEPR